MLGLKLNHVSKRGPGDYCNIKYLSILNSNRDFRNIHIMCQIAFKIGTGHSTTIAMLCATFPNYFMKEKLQLKMGVGGLLYCNSSQGRNLHLHIKEWIYFVTCEIYSTLPLGTNVMNSEYANDINVHNSATYVMTDWCIFCYFFIIFFNFFFFFFGGGVKIQSMAIYALGSPL